jgi:hypothetical protein
MWLERFGGACVAVGAIFAVAAEPTDSETVAFFESGAIPVLRLELSPAARQRLRDEPREYARCTLVEDGTTVVARAGVKLKGAAGSYRDFDDRPALTLKIDKYEKGGRWHGMQKFHLNNAVQDETYLCEWLGARLFRAAGYPAPLAGHVRLWIDDRDLGLYVLREGFDEPFLERTFGAAEGTLYDGGFLQDLDEELEMDVGEDPDDRDDLVGLAAAGRGIFLPHGMDQLFGDPEAGVFDHASPLVAAAVMQDDRWRDRYREKLGDLVQVVRPVDRWLGEVDTCHDRLQAILADVDIEAAAAHRERVAEFKERLVQRVDALDRLLATGPDEPLALAAEAGGPLADWQPAPDAEDMRLEEEDVGGVPAYGIVRDAFGDHASSWRRQVLLPRGRYRFIARVRTEGVIPIPDDQAGGAGIRLAGTGRADEVAGTTPWRTLIQEFVVREDQKLVELILELRARRGRAWFDRESLRLERLGEP